ncbi:MAG: CocE/NonD family hydrolase [Sandaracinaceae bacterium]
MRVPAMIVGGFHDLQPTFTVDAWRELVTSSDPSVRAEHRLLLGPWIHFAVGGEVESGAGRVLDDEERTFLDLERRIDRDSLAWFDHHLRGRDNEVGGWAPVRYHVENDGWHSANDWPPPDATTRTFYLRDDGALSETAPTAGTQSFDHDPADPSPTIGGATLSPYNCMTSPTPLACVLAADPATILRHGPRSQAPVTARSDQRTFLTPPLTEPLPIVGEVRVQVDVATTGDDGDVAVRLVDVDDAGDPLLVAEGIARLRARDATNRWSAVTPGTRYSLAITMLSDVSRTIQPGHRLGIIVSATHWPLFGRNPNDGAVFYAGDTASGTPASLIGAGRPATHTLHLDGATRIELQSRP